MTSSPTLLTRIFSFLAKLLVFVLGLLLCLPVILLPLATAVPALLWILLAILAAVLLVVQFRLKPVWKGMAASQAGLVVVAVAAVVASQAFATTPPIVDAQGEPLPGSIATLEQVTLNGSQQWISIRGHDTSKPVLLFLAGGPGGSQLATARYALGGLEEHFVVVNWEQPGAGKSFDAVDRSTITPERYIEDAHALVQHLRRRFGQDKVYVLGESWGSALGILLVQRYPELFHAFVGTGQMVAFLENDLMCYDFAVQWARERGDTAKVAKLAEQGPPPYYGDDVAWKESAFLMDTFNYMNQNPAIADNGANTFRDLAAPEYGLYDKVSWFRGVLDTLGIVYPQLWDVDFRTQAAELTEQYFNLLDAPQKEIVWFEHSGHTPWVSESDRFVQAMVDTVLAQQTAGR